MLSVSIFDSFWRFVYIGYMRFDGVELRECLVVGFRLALAHLVPFAVLTGLLSLYNVSLGLPPAAGLTEFWVEGGVACFPFSATLFGLWVSFALLTLADIRISPKSLLSCFFIHSAFRTYRWVRRAFHSQLDSVHVPRARLSRTLLSCWCFPPWLATGWVAGRCPQLE